MEKLIVGQAERKTQERIIKLFSGKLLGYSYLGNWEDRENSNIEEEYLIKFLKKQGYNDNLIKKALFELQQVASNQNKGLYDINKEVYSLLRYGIQVKDNIGETKQTVWLIDWNNKLNNDFYIAEEVTVRGEHDKRPDIVLYVNGVAVAVLELKRSTISVSQGIRQNLDNQKQIFIKQFFATIQLVMAGNDTEGLSYATTETPEKYYLKWKEHSKIKNKLEKDLSLLCSKERLLEIIHDFIVFDFGVKKICRHNQYFGVKACQAYLKRRKGGIIWHTQGSGKSLIMIWLAKWIRENITDSRVLIITDREELDSQIENFFKGVDEQIYRTESGKDLIQQLMNAKPWLMCSLIHKFGTKKQQSEEQDLEEYIQEIMNNLPTNFKPKGDLYVFVDECHRTQSGKLHGAMKGIIPNAIFIGFTGTPLLKKDKKTSRQVFGDYIHTYKYNEAVSDNVVLDLQYEAREVDQRITSQEKIDQWFEAKTRGLTEYAKAELKTKWGTMQKVLSSQPRLNRIVADIMFDMETKNRLLSGRGNAMLVSGSIYQACQYYELFQNNGLKKCAIITSYSGDIDLIKGESTGEDDETDNIFKYETYQKMIAYYEGIYPEIKTKGFEEVIKEKFVKEPGQMKLLIVVDKLLTGFDAPPATYLYIDKSMQDHGLFQAICRVNRLDGEDKDYGYIIDYKDLFKSLSQAVKDYTTGAFSGFDKEDVEGLLKDRLKTGKENLDSALEGIKVLCEPVKPPKDSSAYIEYFCGNTEKPEELAATEQKRISLYKLTSKLLRSYVNIANEMKEAGYSQKETEKIKQNVSNFENIRSEIKLASHDYIDLKAYEPAMRHLIDSYIDADESKTVTAFDDLTLIDLIVNKGVDAIDSLPKGIKENKNAVAETIENNVRRLIIEEKPTNPKYFEKMSVLLDELIRERKQNAVEYANYLKRIVNIVRRVKNSSFVDTYPKTINTKAKKALYDNLENNEELALKVNEHIETEKSDGWRGSRIKEKQVRIAIKNALAEFGISDEAKIDAVLELVKNQNEY
ncbi:MAG: HsdR family type I site-specific deoxyribonuclease [Candidatus Bathyarchaeia archaeon]|jgi:type I restriction enzyme R subunit